MNLFCFLHFFFCSFCIFFLLETILLMIEIYKMDVLSMMFTKDLPNLQ